MVQLSLMFALQGCRLRGLWRLGRNNLTIGCDVSCSCLSDVLGSGVEAVGSAVGGEESGLGGLECLGP